MLARKVRLIVVLGLTFLLGIATCFFAVYRASQSVPDFYQEALVIEIEAARKAGDELEHQIFSAQNQFEDSAAWQLVLTDEQINGWLSTDLNEKFPQLLPTEASEPRVNFVDGQVQIACRINTSKLSTVLSVTIEAYLTDCPNEIAIRFHKVRAGSLPVPLTELLDEISTSGHGVGILVRWTQQAGDPVALIELPTERNERRRGVVLKQLCIFEGRIEMLGTAQLDQSRMTESEDERFNSQR